MTLRIVWLDHFEALGLALTALVQDASLKAAIHIGADHVLVGRIGEVAAFFGAKGRVPRNRDLVVGVKDAAAAYRLVYAFRDAGLPGAVPDSVVDVYARGRDGVFRLKRADVLSGG